MDVSVVIPTYRRPAAARNAGARAARGRHLAFTDDDCWPEAGWLRELAAPWRSDESNEEEEKGPPRSLLALWLAVSSRRTRR